mmetsp:Transcript_49690/g.142579  ORF Transcript_49690/g.142579 Transcript_49690/m.142579 type:complete len:493 (-) Transcript_49690:100-1578(-)
MVRIFVTRQLAAGLALVAWAASQGAEAQASSAAGASAALQAAKAKAPNAQAQRPGPQKPAVAPARRAQVNANRANAKGVNDDSSNLVPRGLPARRLTGSDPWQPTSMLYLKGRKAMEHFGFIGFKDGGIAALNLNSSELLWAHEPLAAYGSTKAIHQKMGVVVTTTETGQVQAWDAWEGVLKWERSCPGGVVHRMLDIGGADDGFGFACATEVEARTLDGVRRWATPSPIGTLFKAASAVDSGKNICALALGTGISPGALALKLNSYTGAIMSSVDAPQAVVNGLSHGSFITTGGRLVWPTTGKVHTYSLCGDGDIAEADSVAADETATVEAVQDTPGIFSVTNGVVTGIFASAGPDLRRIKLVDRRATLGPVHGAIYGETGRWVAVLTQEQAGSQVQIINAKHGGDEGLALVPGSYSAAMFGVGERVVAQEDYGGNAFRAILATKTLDSVLAIQGSDVHWSRDGFLAESVVILSTTTTTTTFTTSGPAAEL